MKKQLAIKIFGESSAELARALGVTPQAASAWPEDLPLAQADRVAGAALRLG